MGSGSDQKAFIWPAGYSAAGNPLGVYNASGKLTAIVGEPVELSGGNDFYSMPAPVLGCADFDKAWIVGSVVQSWLNGPSNKPTCFYPSPPGC